jgi:ATP-binding cassette subfamily F protein uup
MNYLSVESLSKAFGEKKLFKDISFGIDQGQKIALVGINGTGKSTLMKIIMGLEVPDSGAVAVNQGIKVSYVHQNPVFEPGLSIFQTIFSASSNEVFDVMQRYQRAMREAESGTGDDEEFHRMMERMDALQAWDYEYQVEEVSGKLGLNDTDLMIETLSGGQRKRVALAKAILEKPDLLLLDEPTNHLDLETIEWLEEYLSKANLSLFMVTHDRYFLEKVTNEILELDEGKIFRYQGNYSYFLEKKEERRLNEATEHEKAKSLYKKELDWVRRQPKARTTKAKYRVDAFEATKEKALAKKDDREIELTVSSQRLGNSIIELDKIHKSFGDKKILDDFSYTFKKGDKIGIVGPNGAGKTTFLNMLIGQLAPDSGKIKIGQTTAFGYYKQEELSFDEEKRLIDIVSEIAEVVTVAGGSTITVSQFLNKFGFPPKQQHTPVGNLSGGERRRLQMLMVLIKNPNFLILDEPTNDLDIMTLNTLEEFLDNFPGCLIIVSHDRYFMDRLVEHLFVFQGEGRIKDFPGNYSEFREWEKEQKSLEKNKISENKDRSKSKAEVIENKSKANFKQKQEFGQIQSEISTLESEKAKLIQLIHEGTDDHETLVKRATRIQEIDKKLESLEFRWLDLSELEGID